MLRRDHGRHIVPLVPSGAEPAPRSPRRCRSSRPCRSWSMTSLSLAPRFSDWASSSRSAYSIPYSPSPPSASASCARKAAEADVVNDVVALDGVAELEEHPALRPRSPRCRPPRCAPPSLSPSTTSSTCPPSPHRRPPTCGRTATTSTFKTRRCGGFTGVGCPIERPDERRAAFTRQADPPPTLVLVVEVLPWELHQVGVGPFAEAKSNGDTSPFCRGARRSASRSRRERRHGTGCCRARRSHRPRVVSDRARPSRGTVERPERRTMFKSIGTGPIVFRLGWTSAVTSQPSSVWPRLTTKTLSGAVSAGRVRCKARRRRRTSGGSKSTQRESFAVHALVVALERGHEAVERRDRHRVAPEIVVGLRDRSSTPHTAPVPRVHDAAAAHSRLNPTPPFSSTQRPSPPISPSTMYVLGNPSDTSPDTRTESTSSRSRTSTSRSAEKLSYGFFSLRRARSHRLLGPHSRELDSVTRCCLVDDGDRRRSCAGRQRHATRQHAHTSRPFPEQQKTRYQRAARPRRPGRCTRATGSGSHRASAAASLTPTCPIRG